MQGTWKTQACVFGSGFLVGIVIGGGVVWFWKRTRTSSKIGRTSALISHIVDPEEWFQLRYDLKDKEINTDTILPYKGMWLHLCADLQETGDKSSEAFRNKGKHLMEENPNWLERCWRSGKGDCVCHVRLCMEKLVFKSSLPTPVTVSILEGRIIINETITNEEHYVLLLQGEQVASLLVEVDFRWYCRIDFENNGDYTYFTSKGNLAMQKFTVSHHV